MTLVGLASIDLIHFAHLVQGVFVAMCMLASQTNLSFQAILWAARAEMMVAF